MEQKIKLKRDGFTLIELMIVVAIVGILASIAIPKFSDLIIKSKEASIKGKLGSIRSAITIYYSDTEGLYPQNLQVALTTDNKYLSEISEIAIPENAAMLNPGHPASSSVSNAPQIGGWFYTDIFIMVTVPIYQFVPNPVQVGNVNRMIDPGSLSVNCGHLHSKRAIWFEE